VFANISLMSHEHLIGVKYGHLTILGVTPKRNTSKIRVSCKCDCGKITDLQLGNLVNGHTKSCGCLRKPHGKDGTRIYNIWSGMIDRCCSPNYHHYQDYGGRGITVYEPWRKFVNWYDYIKSTIGEPPTPQHSIDRINNNGNYEPGNIKWSTPKEQQNNKRTNHYVSFNGETKTLTQWAESLNITPITLWHRLTDLHWSVERALTEPIHSRKAKPKPPSPSNGQNTPIQQDLF
jgi:hypothetical protein